jgi:hypothetical protein
MIETGVVNADVTCNRIAYNLELAKPGSGGVDFHRLSSFRSRIPKDFPVQFEPMFASTGASYVSITGFDVGSHFATRSQPELYSEA